MLQPAARTDFGVYEPRIPRAGHYYRCVAAHFEELEAVWDDRYSRLYGFWRPHAMEVIYRYLDCGDLHFGFARVKCYFLSLIGSRFWRQTKCHFGPYNMWCQFFS